MKLTKEEIVEACRDWLMKTHGIDAETDGNEPIFTVGLFANGGYVHGTSEEVAVEFRNVTGKSQGGPYR